MGNAVLIPSPSASVEALDEEDTRRAFGKFWNEDIAMRFRTLAKQPKWTRLPATPFEEAKWLKEDTGRITRHDFDELVAQAKYNVETKVNPVVKAQVALSITRLQANQRSRRVRMQLEVQHLQVTLLQRTVRGQLARANFRRRRQAAMRVQRLFRQVVQLMRHKAATLVQSAERRRQAKNRVAMQHAKRLAEQEEELVNTIVKKQILEQETQIKGLILSLPYPWCDKKEAAAAQHVYDGHDETRKVEGLSAGAADTSLSIGDVFVWIFGALVQLENLGGHYVEYKEAIDALLCQSTVWRDGESNGREKNYVALQQHAEWRIKKLSAGLETKVYSALELDASFAFAAEDAMRNVTCTQEDIIPTPHHSDSKHASRTSKQYFIIVLQYLAMAIDGYFQDMTREVGQNTDGSHFCKGVKSVTKMLQKLQEQELAALMNPDATNAGGMGNGPGPHAKVAPNCDVVRCSLTFDSVEMLREAYQDLLGNAASVHVTSTMGPAQDLDETYGNRDITLHLEYRPDGLTWGDVFDDQETVLAWEEWENNNPSLSWYINQARAFLKSGEVRRQQAAIIGEVKLYLRQYQNFFKCTKLYRLILQCSNPLQLMHAIEPEAADVHRHTREHSSTTSPRMAEAHRRRNSSSGTPKARSPKRASSKSPRSRRSPKNGSPTGRRRSFNTQVGC